VKLNPVALLGAAVAAAALAGCSGDDPTVSVTAPSGVPTGPAAATSLTDSAPSSGASGASGAAACPVDAATLERALGANPSLEASVQLGEGGLEQITCVPPGFATARTGAAAPEPAVVLFLFDRANGRWEAIAGGTEVDCVNKVPAAVAAQLPGCRKP
jgi:hypothetical protein